MRNPRPRLPAVVAAGLAAVLAYGSSCVPAGATDTVMLRPVLRHVELTHTQIHAVGAEQTGLPKSTRLKLTLNLPALVRIRVKDVDPYGLSRAFAVALPAGPSAVPFSARVDGTKLPPGKYRVLVKAHSETGHSKLLVRRLRIIGKNG